MLERQTPQGRRNAFISSTFLERQLARIAAGLMFGLPLEAGLFSPPLWSHEGPARRSWPQRLYSPRVRPGGLALEAMSCLDSTLLGSESIFPD